MNPVRSMLFTPGDRLDMVEKATRSGTDAVIVDLEDAVATENKPLARGNLAGLPPSPVPYYVRTNAAQTPQFWDDVAAAGRADIAGIVLSKSESPTVIAQVDGALTIAELDRGRPRGAIGIIPLIESALGVRLTFEIATASPRVECVMFGGGEQGDLVADLGAEWTPEGTGLMQARSQVLLAARAAGVPYPIEAVFMDFRNNEGLRVESELARTLGYVGKVAIHPAQVPVINEVFTPPEDVVAYQRKVLAAFEEAEAAGKASIAVDGRMVDYAVARVARTIIARAEAAAGAGNKEQ
ncbi:MAG TPA: CoA ester lyase [Acidimicrobiia bacterium]|jgi:citrate lyase subunit beta/citryl-CoA lyase|nr:CoA ester lyase [Acidimicrobiia bacterium]